MNPTITLGRIAGVRVGVNWSVLVIWWLLTWNVATVVVPEASTTSDTVAWVLGAVVATAFFASLLAHELSHAVVARRNGVRTEQITLWLFGGVAQLEAASSTPEVERRIAAAGPAMSLALGAGFLVLAGVSDGLGLGDAVGSSVAWLGATNLLLGVFNLLPAFPLDGGRILHSRYWRRSGDRDEATRRAARVGRAVALFLVWLGIIEFTAGYAGGLWLALIALFLLSAGSAEVQAVTMNRSLAEVSVNEVMTPDPAVVGSWLTVAELLHDHMLRLRHVSFPVVDRDGELVGLVTLDHVKEVPADERETRVVGDITVPLAEVARARTDEHILALVGRLSGRSSRRILVFDGDEHLVGIVTPADVARAIELVSVGG